MRQAGTDDLGVIDAISHQCGMASVAHNIIEGCLVFIGEHGYVIVDPMDESHGIPHVAVTPRGRGKWGKQFFNAFLRWVFTHTRIETLAAMIPMQDSHVVNFATNSWFKVAGRTPTHTYLHVDMLAWMAQDPECLLCGEGATSDFAYTDPEMVKRVTGACRLMRQAGMDGKAWYIYQLYAKLFGYKAEV